MFIMFILLAVGVANATIFMVLYNTATEPFICNQLQLQSCTQQMIDNQFGLIALGILGGALITVSLILLPLAAKRAHSQTNAQSLS